MEVYSRFDVGLDDFFTEIDAFYNRFWILDIVWGEEFLSKSLLLKVSLGVGVES